ncbi:MAG: hypothetical protein LBK23_10495 [Oscillospiraceae bacterium]|jgi:hypothetical protein|nr:hypothetical protein [Oscillospiraceae bacterium]
MATAAEIAFATAKMHGATDAQAKAAAASAGGSAGAATTPVAVATPTPTTTPKATVQAPYDVYTTPIGTIPKVVTPTPVTTPTPAASANTGGSSSSFTWQQAEAAYKANPTTAAIFNYGGFAAVADYYASIGNTAAANNANAFRDQKIAASSPITWDVNGQSVTGVSTSQNAAGYVPTTPSVPATPSVALPYDVPVTTPTSSIPSAIGLVPNGTAGVNGTDTRYSTDASGKSVTGGDAPKISDLLGVAAGGTPDLFDPLVSLYTSGQLSYEGLQVGIAQATAFINAQSEFDAATAEYNAAQKRGDTAAMQKAQAQRDQAMRDATNIVQSSGGLINDPLYADGSGRTLNLNEWLRRYGVSEPVTEQAAMTASNANPASYGTLPGQGFSDTAPAMVRDMYPINSDYGGANSTGPVADSNALEQAVSDVVDFNDNATDLLYNSPEYQAQRKALEIDLLRAYQNMIGTRSGASGVAGTNTMSALGQMYNQAYADLYDVIPQDIANLYGRAVTGLDAVRQYENDAYAQGADTRDYDTGVYQWQYAQNKDNFLTDRNFQYLLNRDWIADQRYADETAWNRAMAERQQAFNEWSNTYRNADGSAMSAAEFAQAQQQFNNAQALAEQERLALLASGQYYAYMQTGSSGGGSGDGLGLNDYDWAMGDGTGETPTIEFTRQMQAAYTQGLQNLQDGQSAKNVQQSLETLVSQGVLTAAQASQVGDMLGVSIV